MANQFLTTAKILQSSLPVLRNELTFSRHVDTQYSDEFAKKGAKVGAQVNARKPPKYRGRYGNAIDVEDIQETPVPVVVDKLFGVDLEYDDVALTLTMDNFQDRYIDPVMARVANEIDFTGMNTSFQAVYNFIGVPNAILTNRIDYLNLGVKLDATATPRRGKGSRNAVISPQMQANLADSQAALFNRQSSIAEQYDTGEMGFALGLDFAMDQNTPASTIGALGGTPVADGGNQTGSTINIRTGGGAVTNYFLGTECITFNNVFGIVPNTATKTGGGVSTGQLQQFVVLAAANTDVNGKAAISISPPIITSGAFQNCTISPADGAAILIFGNASTFANLTIKNGLIFHKNAFTRVMVDLPVPNGVDMGGRIRDKASGLAFRLVRAYDIRGNTRPTRVEALWGWAPIYPEWAARAISSQ
jgi:hypothetical protein